jgi:hypothetical protein
MKIREVLDKKIGEKRYNRFIVILPKEAVKKSKLKGKELEISSKEGEIKLKKRKV